MVFERAVENGLSVQGGYLTYRERRPKMEDEKDEYVYYPQNRVKGKLLVWCQRQDLNLQ